MRNDNEVMENAEREAGQPGPKISKRADNKVAGSMWSNDEHTLVKSLVEDITVRGVSYHKTMRKYQGLAKEKGLPHRSSPAVRSKLRIAVLAAQPGFRSQHQFMTTHGTQKLSVPRTMESIPEITTHAMTDETLLRLAQARRMHEVFFNMNLAIRSAVKDVKLDEQSMIDLTWLLKNIVDRIDDVRKESELTIRLLENTVCAVWSLRQVNGPENGEPSIRGRIALGVPDMKMMTTLPRKDTPEYRKMMTSLGVSSDLIDKQFLDIHWPRFCEHLMRLQEKGLPIPDGLDPSRTYPKYTLATRAGRGVNIDDLVDKVNKHRQSK